MTYGERCIYACLSMGLLFLPCDLNQGQTLFAMPSAHADCLDIDADPDLDSDGDDVADCEDECPSDRNKTLLGICGCGVRDDDLDHDGWIDQTNACPTGRDECPADNEKSYAGLCGCGFHDVTPYEDGSVECDNPEDEDIQIKLLSRGKRVTVKLTRFQGAQTYRLAVQKQNSRGRFAKVAGSPYSNASGEFVFRLDPGIYRFIGQVRHDEDRSRAASLVHQVNRR